MTPHAEFTLSALFPAGEKLAREGNLSAALLAGQVAVLILIDEVALIPRPGGST